MPRGKRGPTPGSLEDIAKGDPTIEEIVGKENVVDVGNSDDDHAEEAPKELGGYKCSDCTFTSKLLSEIEEHCNGTQHGGFKDAPAEAPVQPELFTPKGAITKKVRVPMDREFLNEQRQSLAFNYQRALDVKGEKKAADAEFNAQLASIDERMQEIARVLAAPYIWEDVKAEWRVIEGENARGLFRIDTGEMLEKEPLSQEDREAELQKAAADNEAPEPEEIATESEDAEEVQELAQ